RSGPEGRREELQGRRRIIAGAARGATHLHRHARTVFEDRVRLPAVRDRSRPRGGRRHQMRRVVLLLLFAAAGCNDKKSGEAQAAEGRRPDFVKIEPGSPRLEFIKIEAVKESEAGSSVNLPAKVGFDEDHTQRVATPIDGRVTTLLVKVGDKVRAGQALVELASPQVGQLQADALKAQHDLDVAQKALDRTEQLKPEGAVSQKDAAQAEADYKKSRADVARTAAQLRALGISAS